MTVPMPHASPRPGLYNQASRSIVDLLSMSRKEKEIEIALIMQEGERFLAMLSMVTGGKNLVLPVTDNGGI